MTKPVARLISWLQMCLEADPDFNEDKNQPEQYEFSNGRIFYHGLPWYPTQNGTGTGG